MKILQSENKLVFHSISQCHSFPLTICQQKKKQPNAALRLFLNANIAIKPAFITPGVHNTLNLNKSTVLSPSIWGLPYHLLYIDGCCVLCGCAVCMPCVVNLPFYMPPSPWPKHHQHHLSRAIGEREKGSGSSREWNRSVNSVMESSFQFIDFL